MVEDHVIVEARALTKVYGNKMGVRAVDGVNLAVERGEFLALMGPSGSGKSTLLNLIGTLDAPTTGRVIVNGIDVGTLRGNQLADFRRAHIGFVFQLFNLIPALSALENVTLPLIPYRRHCDFDLTEKARELLKSVGLGERMEHLPSQLSGGEQQRVAIARALINQPKLVLADEPTGNVDSKAGQEIIALLRELNRDLGVTLVLVTHDQAITSQADRVVYLRDGRLLGGRN